MPSSPIAAGSVTITDAYALEVLGLAAFQNPADAASNQVAIFKSGNRGTPANDDEGFLSFFNDDSTGAQVEFSRLTWIATDVQSGSKDSAITFSTYIANSFAERLRIEGINLGLGTANPAAEYFPAAGAHFRMVAATAASFGFERTDATARKWEIGIVTTGHFDFVDTVHSTSVPRVRITNAGSLVTNSAALATNATDGFLYIPTSAGVPTGVPTAQTGTVAMQYDTTNDDLYIYNAGWVKVALA